MREEKVVLDNKTLFNLWAIGSDIEHEFFEMSLRLNSI
jgi:hypothetical protein